MPKKGQSPTKPTMKQAVMGRKWVKINNVEIRTTMLQLQKDRGYHKENECASNLVFEPSPI
jgi:hypothetical protein